MTRRFDDAWQEAVTVAREVTVHGYDVVLVRDLLGRVAVVVADTDRRPYPEGLAARTTEQLNGRCAPFVATSPLLMAKELFAPESILSAPNLLVLNERDEDTGRGRLSILERGLVGAGWRTLVESPEPNRVTLYGFKGGVGRSTATAVLARHLARLGRCVLAVDLDLESPGTSAVTLQEDDLPDHGIIDFLIESGVGNVDGLDCVSRSSSLLGRGNGEVVVAPAGGRPRAGYSYLPKLNRAYLDHAGTEQTFVGRLRAAVDYCSTEVERRSRRPDVVLLDSRSGMHDLAAAAITQLSDLTLLFGVDNAQTWSGYRELFGQWSIDPYLVRGIRERLRMVAAMVPASSEDEYLGGFRDRAQTLFAEYLYDEVAVGDVDAFNPPLTDTEAPHYPLPILFSSDLVGIDVTRDTDWLDQDFVSAAFGRFVSGATSLIIGNDGDEP